MDICYLHRSLPALVPSRSHLPLASSISSPIKSLSFISNPGAGFRCIRAMASEEGSTFVSELEKERNEAAMESKKEETPYTEISYGEQSPEKSQTEDFINKVKLDSNETYYSVLLYGSGALAALWLSSAVVGALDSIPLIPKVFEVVGLAYTIWFSYRYLIFKNNREELFAKIDDLKEKIIGTDDN